MPESPAGMVQLKLGCLVWVDLGKLIFVYKVEVGLLIHLYVV